MRQFNFKKAQKEESIYTDFGKGLTDAEFASFCKTPDAIRRIVMGRITEVGSGPMYIDGAGQRWPRASWKARFGYDPEPAWERMRRLNIVSIGGN